MALVMSVWAYNGQRYVKSEKIYKSGYAIDASLFWKGAKLSKNGSALRVSLAVSFQKKSPHWSRYVLKCDNLRGHRGAGFIRKTGGNKIEVLCVVRRAKQIQGIAFKIKNLPIYNNPSEAS